MLEKQAMKWSTAIPENPGWYWVQECFVPYQDETSRKRLFEKIGVVEIRENNGKLIMTAAGSDWHAYLKDVHPGSSWTAPLQYPT